MDTTMAPIGEVTGATTTYFTAQCIEIPRPDSITPLLDPPPFGSLVRVGGPLDEPEAVGAADFDDPFETTPTLPSLLPPDGPLTIYAVVCEATTGSVEPGRPIMAFGLAEEELRAAQPQIYELLATRFTALPVAHRGSDGVLRPHLPPLPARPHTWVWPASAAETRMVMGRLEFLRGLLTGSAGATTFPADALIAAMLRNACAAAYGDTAAGGETAAGFLLRAGRTLAAMLPNDYDRLRALMDQVAPGP